MAVDGSTVSTTWLVQPLALVLASRPDTARALADAHRPDSRGGCRRCRRSRPFPCWSALVGSAAVAALEETSGAGPPE